MILDGEVDYLPEPAFLNVGTIEEAIEKGNGGKPDSQKVYVDEACFACDDTVSSFKTDEGKDITMTVVDDKVLKERAY